MQTAARYTLFALFATIANIGSQDITLRVYAGAGALAASVLVGTAVGLALKYMLDKKYIFQYHTTSPAHDTRVFMFYALVGVFTTAIFWGFEFAFHYLFQTKAMRYCGGVIGLGLGYYLKYRLDKRFVFVPAAGVAGGPIGMGAKPWRRG